MFYKGLEYREDPHDAVYAALGETLLMIVIWCLFEAFLVEHILDLFIGICTLFQQFFRMIHLQFLGFPFELIEDGLRHFSFLGRGDLKQMVWHGFCLWLFTGLPVFLYKMSHR